MPATDERIVRFGVFEVDLQSGELRKAGRRIALQEQPFRVLLRLLNRPGELVTREELRSELWPADTFVDFEQGLNAAVKRLREALGDSADSPRYVETLARRGYRFIGPLGSSTSHDAHGTKRVPTRNAVLLLVTGIVSGACVAWVLLNARSGVAMMWNLQRRAPTQVFRSLISVSPADGLNSAAPEGVADGRPASTALAIAPDGQNIVFSGVLANSRQLFIRRLERLDATPLAGSEGAQNPFFSPDGQWVGYWARRELRKVSRDGGPSVTICALPWPPFGATWDTDDRIVFSEGDGGLWQVSASGGPIVQLSALNLAQGEVSHRLPHALPDGDVLFTITYNRFPRWTETRLAVFSRQTRSHRVVLEGGADGQYVRSGHVVYIRSGALMAVPFDVHRVQITGATVSVMSDVLQSAYSPHSPTDTGAGQFAISAEGTLVYVPGGVIPDEPHSVCWVDRTGHAEKLPMPLRPFAQPRLAPTGERIALYTAQSEQHIWIYDRVRRTLTRLTTEGRNASPIWSPDGRRIAYRSSLTGPDNLFWLWSDRHGAAQRLTKSSEHDVPAAWSSDGHELVFYRFTGETVTSIWTISLDDDRTTKQFIGASTRIGGADLSPDGKWLAYATAETGRFEVYVEAFPSRTRRQQVSIDGGVSPVWRQDGSELFFVATSLNSGSSSSLRMMSVGVSLGSVPRFGTPRVLFEGPYLANIPARAYDASADGQHFVLVRRAETPALSLKEFVLVQNWFEELKAKVPGK